MGFFHDIQMQFGRPLVLQLKEFSNNNSKLSRLRNRRIFLLRCRREGITPSHISNNLKNIKTQFEFHDGSTGHHVEAFTHRLEHQIINLEIEITIKNTKYIERRLSTLESSIRAVLPENLWLDFKQRTSTKYNTHFHDVRQVNVRKFERLLSTQHNRVVVQSSWLKNLTDVTLPDEVKTVLSLGPKFCIPPKKNDVSIPHLLSEVNQATSNIQEKNSRDILTARVTNVITNFFLNESVVRHPVTPMYLQAKRFLEDHPELIVTTSDKGNVTTVMYRDVYDRLALEQLQDTEVYTVLRHNPCSTYQQRALKMISSLKKDGIITPDLASKLSFYKGSLGKFYGLPKIHKEQLALRPIISSINSPNTGFAVFIRDVLTQAYDRTNPYYVSDSFHFAEMANNFEIPQGHVLVSWDVVSLFTNITVELTIRSVEYYWPQIQPHCPVPLPTFIEMIKFVFDTTVFTYNGIIYKQKDGAPMGSLVPPIFAQYVMDMALAVCFPKLPFRIIFCKKFVDDVIALIPAEHGTTALNVLNSYDPRIQFTVEEEVLQSVPFLDTRVVRVDTRLMVDWYQKPMSSGRYLHYLSYHPLKVKINFIINMKSRVSKICHPTFLDKNLKLLHRLLTSNGYPQGMIRRILYNTPMATEQQGRPTEPVDQTISSEPRKTFITLPHVEGLVHEISRLLPTETCKTAVRNVKPLRKIFTKMKDRDEVEEMSDVVYQIPCSNCDQVYIGQTSTKLKQRLALHRSNIRTERDACALSKHSIQQNHFPDLNGVRILDRESNYRRRTFLEMVRICQTDNSINSNRDVDGLSSIYSLLIDMDANIRRGWYDRPVDE